MNGYGAPLRNEYNYVSRQIMRSLTNTTAVDWMEDQDGSIFCDLPSLDKETINSFVEKYIPTSVWIDIYVDIRSLSFMTTIKIRSKAYKSLSRYISDNGAYNYLPTHCYHFRPLEFQAALIVLYGFTNNAIWQEGNGEFLCGQLKANIDADEQFNSLKHLMQIIDVNTDKKSDNFLNAVCHFKIHSQYIRLLSAQYTDIFPPFYPSFRHICKHKKKIL